MNKLDIRYIDYNSIRKNILSRQVRSRLENKIHDTELKIRIAVKEIEMVNTLIYANIKKYLLMLNNSNKMSYYEIDQLCSSTDKTVRYIQKIVLTIPDIIDKTYESSNQQNTIKQRYLSEELNHINKIELDLRTQLSTEYSGLYGKKHVTIRYTSNIEDIERKYDDNRHETIRYRSDMEDIERECDDTVKRREHAKNKKIAEAERFNYMHTKCVRALDVSNKKINGVRTFSFLGCVN